MPRSEEGPAERTTALALAAADAVVAQGYADPSRLGVMGGSLGGYSVCCVVTRCDRFRAAVAVSSFCDLVSFVLYAKGNELLGAPWVEGGILRLGATLWEDPQKYIENSPVFRLDRVETPLLLVHGTADAACPVTQAEEMYAGLLRLGKVAALARYEGEGHDPDEWSAENHADFRTRVIRWFDRFLCEGTDVCPSVPRNGPR
jgi:dipeptidyl aminopeptidase/acylaminoacyl peptidase